ncbi:MAG: succinylglutamate desuccinylase/aspartoacylase family protein [Thaumarchaeota archaeon]|nr:succinylglutamate desuccinylase/aspartoacylase family protein [Nitrososphaerota archaeon]
MTRGFDLSKAKRGEKLQLRLDAFELADGSTVSFPVTIIRGKKPGRTLYVGASAHGDEAYAAKAAAQILNEIQPDTISGTLICVTVENPLAFNARNRFTPLDDRDNNLSDAFPGKASGDLTDRMANVLHNQLLLKAEFVVALHTSDPEYRCIGYTIVPSVSSQDSSRRAFELGRIFGLDFIQGPAPGHSFPKSMTNVLTSFGKPAIIAELGDSRYDSEEEEISRKGVRGVFNVLKHLGMLEGEPELPISQSVLGERANLRADRGGFPIMTVKLGQNVSKGEKVATILNTFGKVVQTIRTPMSGIVLGRCFRPIVHSGDRFMIIGKIERRV